MTTALDSSIAVRAFHAPFPTAAADRPVADDPGSLHVQEVGVVTETERLYADSMEHDGNDTAAGYAAKESVTQRPVAIVAQMQAAFPRMDAEKQAMLRERARQSRLRRFQEQR